MSRSPVLFLHGGPAMGAAMERERLRQLDDCHWWDQPRPTTGARQPYQDLLAAAEVEARRMVGMRDAPLTLVASSFGAVLAAHLATVTPELIARIVLLAPVADLQGAMLRVARRVLAFAAEPAPALHAALAAYDAGPERQRFWAVAHAMLQHPALAAHYWLPGSPQSAWFAQMLARPDMFDLAAHTAVADDYQRTPLMATPLPFAGPVALVFGAADPLTDPAADVHWWRQCFPQASAQLVAAAHFPHLELPELAVRVFGA